MYYYSEANKLKAAKIENKLYRGMTGLEILINEDDAFYTDKQLDTINELCKLLGYNSY